MTNNFFNFLVQNIGTRIAPAKSNSRYLLDKNEQSDDIDIELKKKVLDSLMQANWNRYPASDYAEIESKIADYCGLGQENIVLSAGSASIITTLLDFFALNHKKINIVQPSYSLFDYHCKTYNIPYHSWLLTEDLEYDFGNLPNMDENSVLILTTPNNPVGNSMKKSELEYILKSFPESLIVVDAVYCEFADEDFTPLVKEYDNLIVLRSFSKAFPVAGLRLGYLCANSTTASIIKKLILQFSITHFSLIFAKDMLFNEAFMKHSMDKVERIKMERDRIAKYIKGKFCKEILRVYPSQGNFLLLRVYDDTMFEHLINDLADNGIKILNSTASPLLKNTLRVSIGNPEENNVFLTCLEESLGCKEEKFTLNFQTIVLN